jgi:hypothetical protein
VSTPPGTSSEYSRGTGDSEGVSGAPKRPISGGSGGLRAVPFGRLGAGLFGGAVLGAVLLIVAEFTTLYTQQIATYASPPVTEGTGPHDSYALIPIAVLAVVLGFAVLRGGSRPALLAVGLAGLVALLIAVLGDLPDAHSSGLIAAPSGQFVSARTTPSTGMYLETAGAVVLIATCGLGFMLLGPPSRVRRTVHRPSDA